MNSCITDQTGRIVTNQKPPERIVSCVPSQTELLFDLGMEPSIAGITKFCVHPVEARKTKTVIGGTKNLNLKKIASIEPDFVLANKEENDRMEIEWLAARFPTYISDVRTLNQAMDMIRDVGTICNQEAQAVNICACIESRFSVLIPMNNRPRVAYFIWQNPWMTINSDTFIHDMLNRMGFDNVFAHRTDSRYPVVAAEELQAANPQFIFLSSEPFPFRSSHVAAMNKQFPQSRAIIVDGEMFSWYGSRLKHLDSHFLSQLMPSG